MWPSLDEPALRLGEEVVTYGELLLVGARTGVLEAARAETERSLRLLATEGAELVRGKVREEAVAFRRARRLESGEDLRRWLATRQLTTKEWEGHLRRRLAARSPVDPKETAVEEGLLHEALTIDLACGGWWRSVADEVERYWSAAELATDKADPSDKGDLSLPADEPSLAAAAGALVESLAPFGPLDPHWCADRLGVISQRQKALEEARWRLSSDPAVDARVADHAAEWTEVVFDALQLPTDAAANEAVLCSREDRLTPGEIAQRSGRSLERMRRRHNQLPVGMAALLSGAVPGVAVGPLESDEWGTVVLWLDERLLPSTADPAMRQLAESELLTEALERAAAGRCRALGPL